MRCKVHRHLWLILLLRRQASVWLFLQCNMTFLAFVCLKLNYDSSNMLQRVKRVNFSKTGQWFGWVQWFLADVGDWYRDFFRQYLHFLCEMQLLFFSEPFHDLNCRECIIINCIDFPSFYGDLHFFSIKIYICSFSPVILSHPSFHFSSPYKTVSNNLFSQSPFPLVLS